MLLLAALLGFFIGRAHIKGNCVKNLDENNREWKTKYNHLVYERDELKAKIGAISRLTTERDELSTKLQLMDSIENERDNLTASLAALETENWPGRYSTLEDERNQLAEQLKNKKVTVSDNPDQNQVHSDPATNQKNLADSDNTSEVDNVSTQAITDSTSLYSESDYEIEEVEGIGKGYGKQLREMGIARTSDLISKCSTHVDIKPVADTMKLEEWVISSWTSMADLCRVKGVGGQFAELLDFSGIHSTQQLAASNANGLLVKLIETNDNEHRVSKVPDESVVAGWIENAKTLDVLIQFDD